MAELPGKPGKGAPATVPDGAVLDYHGPPEHVPDPIQPWYIILAALIVYALAGNTIALGAITLCVWAMDGLGMLGMIVATLMILFGVVMLGLEYEAENERSRTCTIIVGIITLLLAVPLGVHARHAMLNSFDALYIFGGLTAITIFCAVAHLVWAVRIQQSPPSSRLV